MDTNPEYQDKYKFRYIETAEKLINSWSADIPLSDFLKEYYRKNKQHGSRDRKIISSLIYNYYRLGNGVIRSMSLKEKISLAETLVWEDFGDPDNKILEKRIESLAGSFDSSQIFKFGEYLSKEIDKPSFNFSFLIQPHLFIRIRTGKENLIRKQLTENKVLFREINESCLALPNRSPVHKILKLNQDAVIQDLNSQRITEMFSPLPFHKDDRIKIWDSCAGSGGKSILISDLYPKRELTVTDKRKSILINLKKRFFEAGIRNYNSQMLDLSEKPASVPGSPFDFIVADLPCSGSGTWGRTPEQMSIFREDEIQTFSTLQQSIIENVLPFLKKNGYLLYITCSVFTGENEENIGILSDKFQMEIIRQEYFKGYEMRADTLFAALLKLK